MVFIVDERKEKSRSPIGDLLLAAELGFEPRQTESESVVLPLHNSATNMIYYNRPNPICQ